MAGGRRTKGRREDVQWQKDRFEEFVISYIVTEEGLVSPRYCARREL